MTITFEKNQVLVELPQLRPLANWQLGQSFAEQVPSDRVGVVKRIRQRINDGLIE